MTAMTALTDLSSSISAVVERTAKHVVSITSRRSRSSGFIWRPGLIVTADEALADQGDVFVQAPGGDKLPAVRVGRDHATDIALLRIDRTDLPALPLATAYPKMGALSLVVGADAGGAFAALGLVSHATGPWRSMRGGEIDARLELDVDLRRGAQGSVALDPEGHGFGMAVRGPRRILVIPAATIERVAPVLEKHGRIPRGYLGVGLQAVRTPDKSAGAMVMTLDDDGPARQAGIHQGDVIVGINGSGFDDVRSLLHALGPDSIGSTIELTTIRAGATSKVSVAVGERPPG